jgi:hypothetical protein
VNSTKLTAGLALTCVVLVSVVAWQAHQLRRLQARAIGATTPVTNSPGSSSSSSSAPDDGAAENTPITANNNPPAAATPTTLTNRPHFDWQQVESADYRTYLNNLRAIGCPEQTVRDIVTADVTQAFAARRSGIMAERFRDSEYWKSNPAEAAARANLEGQRREVDDAMNGTLRELLGSDAQLPATAAAWQQAALEQQLTMLPAGTRETTTALLLQYAGVDAQIRELSRNQLALENPEERQRVIEDYNRKRAALQTLLTPEQYELVDMTVSWTADNLRRAMTRFQPTEEEFRAIFRIWRMQDENLAFLFATGQPDPGNQHVFDAIAQQLTPERYALYRETWWK